MKIRLNKYERTAGLFVGFALCASLTAGIAIALTNSWFSRKVEFMTELESADGVHAGTTVQIAGLRVGSVSDVELGEHDQVQVHLQILEKFKHKVRADSQITMFRPFILSDKVLEVTTGSADQPELKSGSMIPTVASTDVMDLLSGKKMTEVLSSFDHMADSLKVIGTAFTSKERTQSLVQTLDRLNPLVQNLNTMATEVVKLTSVANRDKRAEIIVSNLAQLSHELNIIIPPLKQEAPNVGLQLGQIVTNLNRLTGELNKLSPAVEVLAPELPRTSRRAVEALDEMVVLLKAMQKSFLLRGSVREVKEDEARQPASVNP